MKIDMKDTGNRRNKNRTFESIPLYAQVEFLGKIGKVVITNYGKKAVKFGNGVPLFVSDDVRFNVLGG